MFDRILRVPEVHAVGRAGSAGAHGGPRRADESGEAATAERVRGERVVQSDAADESLAKQAGDERRDGEGG